MGLGTWGYWKDAKGLRYGSPWPKWKTLTGAPLWLTGDKGAPPSPQTLALRIQLQGKAEAPSSAPPQTQLSTGKVINVSRQDEQGSKCTLTACRTEDSDLFVEYESAGFLPKWLLDVMMLGKDVIFYGEADVVHRIGRDMQRL